MENQKDLYSRCECCGTPWEDLPILSKEPGSRSGEKRLCEWWRPTTPSDEEDIRLIKECRSNYKKYVERAKEVRERFSQKYGEDKAMEMVRSDLTSPNMRLSMECFQCTKLDEKAYFEIKKNRST